MEMQEFLDKIDTIRGLLEYPDLANRKLFEISELNHYQIPAPSEIALRLLNELRNDVDIILRESYEEGYEAGTTAENDIGLW